MKQKYSLVLLDRDGVINEKAPIHNYITLFNDFLFLPKSKQALSLLSSKYALAVITNQRGIAKGLITLKDFHEITQKMLKEISNSGGKIEKVYFCPHGENECNCRKPKPGMIEKALSDFQLSPQQVVLLGDSFLDYQTAKNAGCDFIFINTPSDEQLSTLKKFKEAQVSSLTFPSLYEAALFLTK